MVENPEKKEFSKTLIANSQEIDKIFFFAQSQIQCQSHKKEVKKAHKTSLQLFCEECLENKSINMRNL